MISDFPLIPAELSRKNLIRIVTFKLDKIRDFSVFHNLERFVPAEFENALAVGVDSDVFRDTVDAAARGYRKTYIVVENDRPYAERVGIDRRHREYGRVRKEHRPSRRERIRGRSGRSRHDETVGHVARGGAAVDLGFENGGVARHFTRNDNVVESDITPPARLFNFEHRARRNLVGSRRKHLEREIEILFADRGKISKSA